MFDYISQHYQQTGEWMDPNVAAEKVNGQLLELARALSPLVSAQPDRRPEPDLDTGPDTITSKLSSEGGDKWMSPNDFNPNDVLKQAASLLKYKDR